MKKTELKDNQLDDVYGGVCRSDLENADALMKGNGSEMMKPQNNEINMPKIDTGLIHITSGKHSNIKQRK